MDLIKVSIILSMNDQQNQYPVNYQANIGTDFLLRLELTSGHSSLIIKIINHRNFQYFEQIIDRKYLDAHKDLCVYFKQQSAVMNYLVEHIKEIVVTKQGELQIHINMYGIDEIISIKTISKTIDPIDKNNLRVQQLAQQLLQRSTIEKKKYQDFDQKLQTFGIKLQAVQKESKYRYRLMIILWIALIIVVGFSWYIHVSKTKYLASSIKQIQFVLKGKTQELFNNLKEITTNIQNLENLSKSQIQKMQKKRQNDKYYQDLIFKDIEERLIQFKEINQYIYKLQKQIKQMDEKIGTFVQIYEKKTKLFDFGHHPENPHRFNFQITNSGQNLAVEHTSQSNWYNFINKTPLPMDRKTTYRIKLTQVTLKYLYVGFGTRDIFGKSWSSQPQAIYYNCGGIVYEGGTIKNVKVQMNKGDILTLTADLANNTVSWIRNDNQVIAESSLPFKMMKQPIYFVLYFYTKGDKVEILPN